MNLHTCFNPYFHQPACLFSYLIVCIFSSPLSADELEFPPLSYFYISAGNDNNNNRNIQLQLNIELEKHQQISAGLGKFLSDDAELDTTQKFIGIATNPYDSYSLGANYNIWGKTNALETKTIDIELFMNFEQWGISINPQVHKATFYNTDDSKKIDAFSKAISFASTYYGYKNYFIGLNYYINQYNDSFVLNDQKLTQISTIAQLLMSSLEKQRLGLILGHFFSWGSLEVNLTQSKASFLEGKTNTISFIADYQLTNQLNLNLITTRQTSSIDDDSLHAIDIGIGFNW